MSPQERGADVVKEWLLQQWGKNNLDRLELTSDAARDLGDLIAAAIAGERAAIARAEDH